MIRLRVVRAAALLAIVALATTGCGDDGGGGTGGAGGEGAGNSGTGNSGTGNATGSPTCLGDGTCEDTCGSSCADGCGPCPSNSSDSLTCTSSGICKCDSSCTPSCDDKSCGDDGCGGSCGPCDAGSVCAYSATGSPAWACAPFTGPDPNTSFFVTSAGTGSLGGNFGGLEGADAFCSYLASQAGISGKTWRAYLSAGSTAARDRIGSGPWVNSAGRAIVDPTCAADESCVAALHSAGLPTEEALTERGEQVDWANAHDIFTGSNADGTPSGSDCEGWTSNAEGVAGTVGHVDDAGSWVNAHDGDCDQVGLQCTAGQGKLYCFGQ